MRLVLLGLLTLAISSTACKKEESAPATKPTTTASPAGSGSAASAAPAMKDGARIVPIEVVTEGYKPDRIVGKPGEKLMLVFTRKVDGECFEELKPPGDSKVVKLPKDKPYEIPVTVPADGEVKFACGMDMIEGRIVAEKG